MLRPLGAHRLALASMALLGLAYLAALASMPPEGLTHHDTGAKYLQVRNLRITPNGLDWSINYPARRLDPQLEFVPFSPKQHYVDEHGRIYLQWPIFLGLLTRIPWKLIGFWGLYVVPVLAGVGTAWAAYLLALTVGVPARVAWLAIPLAGLATPVSIYSLLFFEHTLAAMLVTLSLLAFAVALRLGAPTDRSAAHGATHTHAETLEHQNALARPNTALVLSGTLLATAIYFRSELYVLSVVMAGLLVLLAARQTMWRARAVIWAGAFLLALVPLWVFYGATEGTLLPLHATWYFTSDAGDGGSGSGGRIALPPVRYIATAGLRVVPDFLLGPEGFPLSPNYPAWVEAAGVVGGCLCVLTVLLGLLRAPTGRRLAIASMAAGLSLIALAVAPILLSAQTYYNIHGFLLAGPFVALALWPPRNSVKREADPGSLLYVITLLYIGLHTLVISVLSGLGPFSRHEWGQRYLLPAYPALVVLALLAAWRIWSEHSRRRLRPLALACLVVCALLAVMGVGFSIRGYAMLSTERQQVVAWQGLARSLPDREPLVTDVWWLPLNLAADFYTRPIMLAEGHARLAQWVGEMRGRGVTAFGFMTNDPSRFESAWRQVAGLRPEGPPRHISGMWLQRYRLNSP
jgi:hypothetical protein